jgi:hypothetical protein
MTGTTISDEEISILNLAVALARELAIAHSSYAQVYAPTVEPALATIRALIARANEPPALEAGDG